MSSTSDSTNLLIALSQNTAEIVETVGKSIVSIQGQRFSCSGIYWQEGIIITSAENIKRPKDVTITLPNGETAPVKLLGSDRSRDVAVFESDAKLPIAPVDRNYEPKVGQSAIAVGRNSRGLIATQGIVGTVGDPWRSSLGGYIDRFIRVDLNLYSGMAGSALVNAEGQVVGFNTTGPRRSVLTIPAATVDRVVTQLLEQGHIRRGYLGIAMQPVDLPDSLVSEFSLQTQQGLMIVNVEPQSPAADAGIILGDILTKIETTSVGKLRDLQAFLEPQNIGKAIAVELIRGGKLENISLTVGDSGNRQ